MTSQQIKELTILDRVRKSLADVFGQNINEQYDKTPLNEIPEIRYDSLTALECVGAVEQEFNIIIDMVEDDVMYNFQSIENVQALVEKKVADSYALEQPST